MLNKMALFCKSGDILWWTSNLVEAQAKAAVLDFLVVEDFCSVILFGESHIMIIV